MDLEAESTITVDTVMTNDIATSCNKLIETQNEVAKFEEQLKKLKETEREYSEQTIPNLMQQAGVRTLKLTDGTSIEVKPYYAAKIPVSKQEEAFDWLRSNGFGDLIKNNVTLQFGKSQDGEASDLVGELKSKGHNVSQKMKVEPMTLKAFVKEQIQNGKDVPMETFGVYTSNRTTVKRNQE
tara:strand:+ start:2969 stop:3514 length:546 start_codon:yes stop_codon:yes gene_type:complete